MSYIPKYILKRMFPKDTCLSLVKYKGAEYLKLVMTNVISPIEVPSGKLDLGTIKLPDDIGKMIKIQVNGKDVPATPQILVNDVMLVSGVDGKVHTFKSIFEQNSAAGTMISVGSKIGLLIKKSAFPAAVIAEMADGKEAEISVVIADANVNINHKAVLNAKGAEFDPKNL